MSKDDVEIEAARGGMGGGFYGGMRGNNYFGSGRLSGFIKSPSHTFRSKRQMVRFKMCLVKQE